MTKRIREHSVTLAVSTLFVFFFRRCKSCPLWFTTKSNCDRHQVRKHGASTAESADGEDGHGTPNGGDEESDDEERGLVHVENGSLVDEDEDDHDPDDDEEEEDSAAVVNGVGEEGADAQLLSLKSPRKRSLMDTIAKLSGSAKKKQV